MPKIADKSPKTVRAKSASKKAAVKPAAPAKPSKAPKPAAPAKPSKAPKPAAPAKKVAKKTAQKAGSLVHDVQNLVVPFGLLLAKNGVEYLAKRSKKKSSKGKRGGDPQALGVQQQGACACGATTQFAGASAAFQTELTNLAQDLRSIVKAYA